MKAETFMSECLSLQQVDRTRCKVRQLRPPAERRPSLALTLADNNGTKVCVCVCRVMAL